MENMFAAFEKENNLTIPLSFKSLIRLFNLNDFTYHYFDEEENWNFRLTKWVRYSSNHELGEILIDTFINRSELIEKWSSFLELWNIPNVLPIAYLTKPANGIILLNISSKNSGEIWLTINGQDYLKPIDKDILTFLYSCEPEYTDPGNRKLKSLYKHLEEEFWRVKK